MICRCRFGEYSGKDFEATISRALLVKPLASMITAYPDIYNAGTTCLEVSLSGSGPASGRPSRWMKQYADAVPTSPGDIARQPLQRQPLRIRSVCWG